VYTTIKDNKATIRCNNPTAHNLKQFWTEVQECLDDGFRYAREQTTLLSEAPIATSLIRVTLFKEPEKENIKPTPEKEPVVSQPKATTKKATAKKPAAKK